MAVPVGEATAATPQPHGPAGAWRMIWHDEFGGDAINTARWTRPEWAVQNVTTNPDNAWVYDGRLTLNLSTATSGALVRSTFGLKPGMIAEARIRLLGSDTGDPIFNWPAWWASGPYVNGKAPSGEHDIVEGLRNGLKITYWDRDRVKISRAVPGDLNNGYHVWTLHRLSGSARVYLDGALAWAYPTNDDGGPEALILSLGAPSADWGQAPVLGKPGRVWVDYVRVWSK
jgi:hypothetical protein